MIESLELKMILMCFKSAFLERQLWSLKALMDLIRNVKNKDNQYYRKDRIYKFLTIPYMVLLIKNNIELNVLKNKKTKE